MANPNAAIAATRNRKTVLIEQRGFNSLQEADSFALEYKNNNKDHIVKVTSYKYGSFRNPLRGYTVRAYEKK